jgi:hypothetical protein
MEGADISATQKFTPAQWKAIGAAAILVAASLVWYSGVFVPREDRIASLTQEGIASLYTGEFSDAFAHFESAIAFAESEEERARLRVLLAASLEAGDPKAAADTYIEILTDEALPSKMRSLSGVYLLMFLNTKGDPAFAEDAFARAPWAALYKKEAQSESLNMDLAITAAHEAIIAENPNFLSYLIAGDHYARWYPYLSGSIASRKSLYAERAVAYLAEGERLVQEALHSGEWDKTRLAIGHNLSLGYAVALSESGLTSDGPDVMQHRYLAAISYLDERSRGEVLMDKLRLSARLSYARYLSRQSAPAAEEVRSLALDIASLSRLEANSGRLQGILEDTNPASKLGVLRGPLLLLLKDNPDLSSAFGVQ